MSDFLKNNASQLTLSAQAASAGMQTVGSYYAAKGQKMQLELQSKMAELNAQQAEGQARDILMQGQRAQQGIKMAGAQIKSSQRAQMAASGVDLASETAIVNQTSTDFLSELDANTAAANALRAAWGQRMQAVNYRNQALMARSTAKAISPGLNALGSLLGSAAQMGMTYSNFQQRGP